LLKANLTSSGIQPSKAWKIQAQTNKRPCIIQSSWNSKQARMKVGSVPGINLTMKGLKGTRQSSFRQQVKVGKEVTVMMWRWKR
jgi:hypothetical protein